MLLDVPKVLGAARQNPRAAQAGLAARVVSHGPGRAVTATMVGHTGPNAPLGPIAAWSGPLLLGGSPLCVVISNSGHARQDCSLASSLRQLSPLADKQLRKRLAALCQDPTFRGAPGALRSRPMDPPDHGVGKMRCSNGVDMHFDWGASQYLTKQFFVGLVGYVYDEVGCDSGSGDHVGCFQSRVIGVGPQVGFIIPMGTTQGYLNLKAYKEFDHTDRPDGWNAWVTCSISPAAPNPSSSRRMAMQ